RPEAIERIDETRGALSERLRIRVTAGYAYGASPTVAEAIEHARTDGARRVIVASYVLAPGHFANLIATAGADVVTDPVGTDPRVAEIVAERYRAALAQFL